MIPDKPVVCQGNKAVFYHVGGKSYSVKIMGAVIPSLQAVVTALYQDTDLLLGRLTGRPLV